MGLVDPFPSLDAVSWADGGKRRKGGYFKEISVVWVTASFWCLEVVSRVSQSEGFVNRLRGLARIERGALAALAWKV